MLLSASSVAAPSRLRASGHRHLSAAPLPLPLVEAHEALAELAAGRAVGLRHRDGYALVAPASLASVPFVECLEDAAGSPVMLVLSSDGLRDGGATGAAELYTGTPATRATAIHQALRSRQRPDDRAGLVVVGANPSGILGRGGGAAEGALELVSAAGFDGGALAAPIRPERLGAERLDALD